MQRTGGVMTPRVESDVTHPQCVLFSSFQFPGSTGRAIVLMYANLPPPPCLQNYLYPPALNTLSVTS